MVDSLSSNNEDAKDGHEPLRTSFTDTELQAALANFEREFDQEQHSEKELDDLAYDNGLQDFQSEDFREESSQSTGDDQVLNHLEQESFQETVEELTGQKASAALIFSGMPSNVFAALCNVAEIDCACAPLQEDMGSVAVLRALCNDEPEQAAQVLSRAVTFQPFVFLVNRASKLEAYEYFDGKVRQKLIPAMVLTLVSRDVEDIVFGLTTLDDAVATSSSFINSRDANIATLIQQDDTLSADKQQDVHRTDLRAFHTAASDDDEPTQHDPKH